MLTCENLILDSFLLLTKKVMKGSPVSKPVEVPVKNPKVVVEKIEKPVPMPTPAPAKQAPAQEATVACDTNDSGNNSNEGRLFCTIFVGFLESLIFRSSISTVYLFKYI